MTDKTQHRRKTDKIRLKKKKVYKGVGGFFRRYLDSTQRYMMTGLLVWVPLMVTIWVSWWFISNVAFGIEGVIERLINTVVIGNLEMLAVRFPRLAFLAGFEYKPAFGFALVAILLVATGFFTRYLAARKIIASAEVIVSRIPGINRLYAAVQQIRDVYVNRGGAVFQRVVLVEYPRPGLLVVGFVTSEESGVVQEAADKDLTAVFVPTTPNPTSGFLLYIPPGELTPLDISVEDAMKLIISGGAFIPKKLNSDLAAATEHSV